MSNENLPAEGWYTDPVDGTRERWWDGEKWSEETRLSAPPPPAYIPPSETAYNPALTAPVAAAAAVAGVSSPMMPTRQINMVDAVKYGFKGYVKWNGRATRSEFWWWILATVIVNVVLSFMSGFVAASSFAAGQESAGNVLANLISLISSAFALAIFLPTLSLMVRRLHDIGRGAAFAIVTLVLNLTSGLVIILLLAMAVAASFSGSNEAATGLVVLFGIFMLAIFGWYIFMLVLMVQPTKNVVTPWDNGYRPSVGQE